ncbi:glycoside hydrolase superfamily, partial [Lipomyces japonicus]|uniref:glycoside hydrolase superfamily n=1 Tax=Lipomyces japonicus TaxID=56871 RepID=UPI0034CF724A
MKNRTKFGIIVILSVIILGVSLGVGLGVGLTRHHDTSLSVSSSINSSGTAKSIWSPPVGSKWQIELAFPLNDTSIDAEIYDVDLFDTNSSTITQLHDHERKVICYFSAGSYENWRPDASEFRSSDIGTPLNGWPGESWLNVSSLNVRRIMKHRLDLAHDKKCDGVDPDNIDGYDNDNGFNLSKNNAINFVQFLANESHARNLSLGLKNAADIILNVIDDVQWSVNEQCVQYAECESYRPFIETGKPVFHIEYPKGDNINNNNDVTQKQLQTICANTSSANFSTVIKNMNLDNWVEYCISS